MNFTYLKRTYPISTYERECDGYKFFMEHSTPEQRSEWGIDETTLKTTIQPNEKYMYQVGKDGDSFKTASISLENFALVRKFIYGIKDEN